MDVARRLVQIPVEKITVGAAARVSALVSEVKKEFENDSASQTLVENLEKMARDENICNAFMHSDAFQSSMFLWDREFKIENSSSSTAVIENQSAPNGNINHNVNFNSYNQTFITTDTLFEIPTFSHNIHSSEPSPPSPAETVSISNSNTSYEPELHTFHAPRWNTRRVQRVPISDRIANYMNNFWKLFFKDQPSKPVVVGKPTEETLPKSFSTESLGGVPGSPPVEMPTMKLAIAGVAILLMATILRFNFSVFNMTAAEGMGAARSLILAFVAKAKLFFK